MKVFQSNWHHLSCDPGCTLCIKHKLSLVEGRLYDDDDDVYELSSMIQIWPVSLKLDGGLVVSARAQTKKTSRSAAGGTLRTRPASRAVWLVVSVFVRVVIVGNRVTPSEFFSHAQIDHRASLCLELFDVVMWPQKKTVLTEVKFSSRTTCSGEMMETSQEPEMEPQCAQHSLA